MDHLYITQYVTATRYDTQSFTQFTVTQINPSAPDITGPYKLVSLN